MFIYPPPLDSTIYPPTKLQITPLLYDKLPPYTKNGRNPPPVAANYPVGGRGVNLGGGGGLRSTTHAGTQALARTGDGYCCYWAHITIILWIRHSQFWVFFASTNVHLFSIVQHCAA